MKTKTQALLIGAGMIAALSSLMLWNARSMIGQIARIYILISCALLALVALAILLWLVKHIWRYVHDMLTLSHNHAIRRFELTERQERWQLEQEERRAAMHILLSRAPSGTVLISPEMSLPPSRQDYLLLPQHAGNPGNRGPAPVGQTPAGQLSRSRLGAALPVNITYEQVRSQIPSGHALLGVAEDCAVETCDFAQLMTMWICGGSNTGKSNTVGLKIEEAIQSGRDIKIILIDPHANKGDSLYNKIRGYESRFLLPVAREEDDILNALKWFYEEFKRRRDVGSSETDILLVIDEVPGVLDSESEEIPRLVKRLARICGRESRGFGMFGWFLSQNAVGLAWLRNVVLTVIAHKMNMLNEAELACNQHKDIARDMENWPKGRVIVYGLNFTGVKVLQMPLFQSAAPAGQIVTQDGAQIPALGSQIVDEDFYYEEDEDDDFSEEDEEADTEDLPIDENLREALDAWRNGARGVRPLQRTLGITYYRAQQLYQDLLSSGLITVE